MGAGRAHSRTRMRAGSQRLCRSFDGTRWLLAVPRSVWILLQARYTRPVLAMVRKRHRKGNAMKKLALLSPLVVCLMHVPNDASAMDPKVSTHNGAECQPASAADAADLLY